MSTLWVGLLCTLPVGCQRRGYTDLYVDSMATEIRDLQDQLYEYDHEYRLLEQELESLRRLNANSRSLGRDLLPPAHRNSPPFEFSPRDALPAPSSGADNKANVQPDSQEEEVTPSELTVPSIIVEPEGLRSTPQPAPEEIQPAPDGLPSLPTGKLDSAPSFEFNADEIPVPSITTGSVQPPNMAPREGDTAPENDLEVGLSQIELPFQLASSSAPKSGARISEAVEVVKDRRVVELAFHPILCRTISFDDDQHDDGIFLVLQPRNREGQFVPSPASLTVEILDSARDVDKSLIGRWSYSATEVAGKIQPIGSQQGIHLTLPWNGPNPKADRVTVRATYTYENGRQVASSKEFFISGPGALKTVWAPRASERQMSGHETQQLSGHLNASASPADTVVTASGIQSVPKHRTAVHPSGQFPPPAEAPSPLR